MAFLLEQIDAIRTFLETGGQVLWAILLVSIGLWSLLLERYWFLKRIYPQRIGAWVQAWQARADRTSWRAELIRDALISEASSQLRRTLPFIRSLIAICPLLGLLGTVTGMIVVFDIIGITGTGNARAMASGVWRATVPTMAGLVAALAGLVLHSRLEHDIRDQIHRLTNLLPTH